MTPVVMLQSRCYESMMNSAFVPRVILPMSVRLSQRGIFYDRRPSKFPLLELSHTYPCSSEFDSGLLNSAQVAAKTSCQVFFPSKM